MTQTLWNRNANGTSVRPYAAGIDRLFDEFTRGLGIAPALGASDMDFAPMVDVSETADEWRVRAELPGVTPEEVEVSVTGNVLTLRGEKKGDVSEASGNWRRSERRYGKFVRALEFPTDVDAKRVEARFKNGVLTVTLPKAETSRPKSISVKVE